MSLEERRCVKIEPILDTIKKMLGISPMDTSFDTDIMVHINTANMVAGQLGITECENKPYLQEYDTWDDLALGNKNLECLKGYFYVSVRLDFDPPNSSSLMESLKTRKNEFEWRLKNVIAGKEV